MMRPRRRRRVYMLATFAALLTGATLGTGVAKADPVTNYAVINAAVVCQVLDTYPTISGVEGVLTGVVNDSGFGYYDAGKIVAIAVVNECPWHTGLLKRFVAKYTPAQTRRI